MDPLFIIMYLLPVLAISAFVGSFNRKVLLFLAWGAIAAVPSLFLNQMVIRPAIPDTQYLVINVSPFIEEIFKVLPIIVLAYFTEKTPDRNVLVYAFAAGIGFSIVENYTLVPPAGSLPSAEFLVAVLTRSLSTSLMHGCTSGIIGYGIVISRGVERNLLPVIILGFFTIAVTTHSFYNLLVFPGVLPYGILLGLVIPFLLFQGLLMAYRVDFLTLIHSSAKS